MKNRKTLDMAHGVTMTNRGTINVSDAENMDTGIYTGTIINEGKIHVWGIIAGGDIINQGSGEIIYHFKLEVAPPTFDEARSGYSQPEAKSITITSTDDVPAKIVSVEIDGEDFVLNAGNKAKLANGASDTSWTIQPKAGLSLGTHTATIAVTYSGNLLTPNKTATATVTFNVSNWAEGSGTELDPYLIPDLPTLEAFRDYINGGKGAGEYFKVTDNIDMSTKYGADKDSWTPIGSSSKPFNGTFDGGGFEISGLYINATSLSSNLGLFGYSYGTIKNLTVSGSVTGGSYVGGIAGENEGIISDCHSDCTVTGGTVTISKASAAVDAAPAVNSSLNYNGEAQALITAGRAGGGTMQYSLDNTTYSADIPTGTEAKVYTVWYKVVGDKNHTDTEPQSVEVTIKKADSALTDDNSEVTYGDTITLVAAVTGNNTSGIHLAAAGIDKVVFTLNGASLGSADVTYDSPSRDSGTAALEIIADKRFAIGANTIRAEYGGSVNLNGSENDSITVTVNKKTLMPSVAASLVPGEYTTGQRTATRARTGRSSSPARYSAKRPPPTVRWSL